MSLLGGHADFFSIHVRLFVCPEVEMVILRTEPPLMLKCGRSNIEKGTQFRM